MPSFPLGEWLPDRSPFGLDGLVTATNVVATARGYTCIPQLQSVTTLSALPNKVIGTHRGRTQSGLEYNAAACANASGASTLHVTGKTNAWVDYSKSGNYTVQPNAIWDFCLYGNNLIAVTEGVPPQVMDITTSGPFADLSADASLASVVTTFKEFTILGNIVGRNANSGIGTQEAGIHWSGIGAPASWPGVGTDPAVDVESDYQVLEGDGGAITDIVPGADYATVFRKHQVWRMDYVSGSAVFRIRKVESRRGSVFTGAAISVGGLVYFAAEEGFFTFDGNIVTSIGSERIDRTWKSLVDFSNTRGASVVHDADTRTIWWTVPTGTGNPSLSYGYNYVMGKWTQLDVTIERFTSTFGVVGGGGVLDSAPYAHYHMDNSGYTPAAWVASTPYSVDDIVSSTDVSWNQYAYKCIVAGTSSGAAFLTGFGDSIVDGTATWRFYGQFNDTTLQIAVLDRLGLSNPTDESMAAFDSGHTMGTFDSTTGYTGIIETGDYEIPGGERNFLRWIRPNTTQGHVSVEIATRLKPSDPILFVEGLDRPAVGVSAFRQTGRYMRARFSLTDTVANFIGFDAEVNPLGTNR